MRKIALPYPEENKASVQEKKGSLMKAIGIDIGTTTISIVVVNANTKELIESKTVPNNSFICTEHAWERLQDISCIVNCAKALLDELLCRHPDIDSIGLTGQMHGILYLDAAGNGISPLYTWQDGRGNLPEFDGKTLIESLSEKYRISAASGYGLVTHLYQSRKQHIPAQAASLCTIADYLGMVLTARAKPLLHTSMAASLGFFDIRSNSFDTEMLKKAGVDLSLLPAVTDDIAVLGTYRSIPVTVAIGDNQAGFLGSCGTDKQALLINMGTGGQISVLSDSYMEAEGIEARPFLKGNYLLVGASLCGGRAYAILENFFRTYLFAATGQEKQQYDVMEKLVQKGLVSSDPLTVVTAFGGTRAHPELRGSISNIGESNFTPEALIFGVLQGMAQELFGLYRKICSDSQIRPTQLIASGNGLRKNKTLQEICSSTFQAPLTLAPYEEEAAYGAALVSTMK